LLSTFANDSVGYDHKGDIVKELMHAAWDAGKLASILFTENKLIVQVSTCSMLVVASSKRKQANFDRPPRPTMPEK
jgi:hypothetical protein